MIKEISPHDLVHGIKETLQENAVVVRGMVDTEQAANIRSLVPDLGKKRVYLSPSLYGHQALKLAYFEDTRKEIGQVISNQLGRTATLWGSYVMKPDILRAGKTKPHLDGRGAIVSASLNLDLGDENETGFFAHRIAETNAPYSVLEAGWEQNDVDIEDMDMCNLGVGDMVIVSRGVVHGSLAPDSRKAITYRTRGLIPADFR